MIDAKIAVMARDVMRFVAWKAKATEANPLRIGNLEIWLEIPEFPAGTCYSLPVNQWDTKAIQDDLNAITAQYWDELVAFLQTGNIVAPQEGAKR